MTHETSQVEGINSNEVDEELIDETNEDTHEGSDNETKTTKGKSNVPKILAEKNKWKAEAEKWKAEAESKEFNEEKAQAMINQALAAQKATDFKNQERNDFINSYGEENVEAVESVLEQHATLSYEDAAKIAGIGGTTQNNPNKYSFAWNTPSSIKQAKTTKTLSDDELRANLVNKFQELGYRNAQ